MKYLVRQKVLTFGDNFTIKDENNYDRYVVEGKVFSIGDKLKIKDLDGNELIYIEQEVLRFLPKYNIFSNGELLATVRKELTFFKPKFHIESKLGEYNMEGDFFSHDFSIVKDGKTVATVSKQWFTLSDTYGVEISDDENQPFMLALAIVIDQVLHDGNK